jgi:UDP-N-acetyl-D-galactosamine dehydrogenase
LQELCDNGNGCGVVIDVKTVLDRAEVEGAGLAYWSL